MKSKSEMRAAAAERRKYEENMKRNEAKREKSEERKKKKEANAELKKKTVEPKEKKAGKPLPIAAVVGISAAAGLIVISAIVWFFVSQPGESQESYQMSGHRSDPKYYEKMLADLTGPDVSARETVLKKLAGEMSAPAVEIPELRKAILNLAEDVKAKQELRALAVKAIGRCGISDDVPRLEQLQKKIGRKEEERLVAEACPKAIDELKNPNKYRW